jgi:DNA-dependent RNA polymerase
MTSVYGVTKVGARAQIQARLHEKLFIDATKITTPEVESQLFGAARWLADWLTDWQTVLSVDYCHDSSLVFALLYFLLFSTGLHFTSLHFTSLLSTFYAYTVYWPSALIMFCVLIYNMTDLLAWLIPIRWCGAAVLCWPIKWMNKFDYNWMTHSTH